ncbi:MAG: hypothetical protein WBH61_09805 [Candidatus Methylomirabilis sp.]
MMSEEAKFTIGVICPCCQARLIVDPERGAVLHHELPPKEAVVTDLKAAVEELKGEAGRREARFKESMEAEKEKGKLLERKFKELLKKAKDEPVARPIRDIDLD